jgi:LysR family glycine cleavage system transcriptional activator
LPFDPNARLPLNALRTFEAAARLGSFLKAAEVLGVTPGAVSRQVQALEAELGLRLFDRFNRAVRLTDAGRRLAEGVSEGLEAIAAAVQRARPDAGGPLVVSVLHSFAAKWLVPRLSSYEAAYPGERVMVMASDQAVDLARESVDVAIRLGTGPYPGLNVQRLFSGELAPVCAPSIAPRLKQPQDLLTQPLIHDVTKHVLEPSWDSWLEAHGLRRAESAEDLHVSNSYLAVDAAARGRGVALAERALVVDDLAAGRVAQPLASLPSPFSHWALCLPERAELLKIRRFRAWLLERVRQDGLAE